MRNTIKVMIAEDNHILRQDFCEMIDNCPDTELIGSASNGEEIIKLSRIYDVDIILMDIEMEKYHDGIEAALIIAIQKPQVGIIFLTVHEDDDTVYRAYSISSAKNYIVKSAEHSEILLSIKEAYEEQKGASPSISSKIQTEFSRLKNTETSLLIFMNLLSRITQAEKEIIKLLLEKRKIEEIAKLRGVEPVTIKSQVNRLLKKFNMKRTREIIVLIKQLNLMFLFQVEDE